MSVERRDGANVPSWWIPLARDWTFRISDGIWGGDEEMGFTRAPGVGWNLLIFRESGSFTLARLNLRPLRVRILAPGPVLSFPP